MNSSNEWGTLKKVIVGIADHARIPNIDLSLRTVNYADVKDLSLIKTGKYPQQVIEEANEDLEILCDVLKQNGVEICRPNSMATPYYNYCPRDTVIVHNDMAIVAPMSLVSRNHEYLSYRQHLQNIKIIENNNDDSNYNLNCVGNPDILALNDINPKFDAANVIRANDDILYLVSNTGNEKGAAALQEALGNQVNIRLLKNVYSYIHIDSTVAFLREGLMLLNPSRIKTVEQLPPPFNKWDAIWAPEPADIGHYPGYCNASKWINVNLLSVNSNLVILEEHQDNLRKILQKYGIESVMLPMRHARTLGGCFHCVTLDLIRNVD
jgi:N-dimethylarginine dimethylaminohydrolase